MTDENDIKAVLALDEKARKHPPKDNMGGDDPFGWQCLRQLQDKAHSMATIIRMLWKENIL